MLRLDCEGIKIGEGGERLTRVLIRSLRRMVSTWHGRVFCLSFFKGCMYFYSEGEFLLFGLGKARRAEELYQSALAKPRMDIYHVYLSFPFFFFLFFVNRHRNIPNVCLPICRFYSLRV